jgi:hypothetical protein
VSVSDICSMGSRSGTSALTCGSMALTNPFSLGACTGPALIKSWASSTLFPPPCGSSQFEGLVPCSDSDPALSIARAAVAASMVPIRSKCVRALRPVVWLPATTADAIASPETVSRTLSWCLEPCKL